MGSGGWVGLRAGAPARFTLEPVVLGGVEIPPGSCFSRPLARLEGRIALGKLFSRFPRLRLAVTPDSPAYRDSTLLHGLVRLLVYVG